MTAPVWSPQRLQEAVSEFRAERSKHGAPHRVAGRLSARWGVPLTAASVERALFRTGLGAWGQYVGQSTPVLTGQNVGSSAEVHADCEEPRTEPSHRLTVPPESSVPPPHRDPKPHQRIFVIPDVHVPFHDEVAWELALRAAERLKPDTIVLLGDFCDAYSISKYAKDPARGANLAWEMDRCAEQLKRLRHLSDDRYFCEGNHEVRVKNWTHEHPEMHGIKGTTIREMIGADDDGWHWTGYNESVKLGKVYFTHEVGYCGKNAAALSLAAFQHNLVFGHSHRGSVVYDGNISGERHFCMNAGWLGDVRHADYAKEPMKKSWQHGVGWVELDREGNGWATFCPIVAGKVLVAGEFVV